MKTDCEPSQYGDHMVILSIKKKEDQRAKKLKKPTEEEESTMKRVSQQVENSFREQSKHCVMHELQKHFDIFALNNHLNQEKNFKFDSIIQAMPSPNDDEIDQTHKSNCSYYKQRAQPKPVIKKQKQMMYDDGTYFLKETHYKGQPLIWEKQQIEAQANKFKITALGRESFSQQITETGSHTNLSHLLAEEDNDHGSMTTLSEKESDQENGSPFQKRRRTDKSLRLQVQEVQQEMLYESPSKRSVKSEDDSPQKIRNQSPSKRKILASKFQKNTSFEEKEKTEWGERLIEESRQIDQMIKSQIEKIQEIRNQTKEAIMSSANVVNTYNIAQESYREHIEAKKFAHLGNENFVSKKLYPKKTQSMGFNFSRRTSHNIPMAQSVRQIVQKPVVVNNLRNTVVISKEEEEISKADQIEAYRKQYQEKLKAQIRLVMQAKSEEKRPESKIEEKSAEKVQVVKKKIEQPKSKIHTKNTSISSINETFSKFDLKKVEILESPKVEKQVFKTPVKFFDKQQSTSKKQLQSLGLVDHFKIHKKSKTSKRTQGGPNKQKNSTVDVKSKVYDPIPKTIKAQDPEPKTIEIVKIKNESSNRKNSTINLITKLQQPLTQPRPSKQPAPIVQKKCIETGVSPRKFETPQKQTLEMKEQEFNKTIVEKPTIMNQLTQIKARNYSLNQMNRKMKVTLNITKANIQLDQDYSSVKKEMPEKAIFFAQRQQEQNSSNNPYQQSFLKAKYHFNSEEKPSKEQAVNKFAQYIEMINIQMKNDKKNIQNQLHKYYNENTKKYQNTMTNVKINKGQQYIFDDPNYNFINASGRSRIFKTPDLKNFKSPYISTQYNTGCVTVNLSNRRVHNNEFQ